MCEYVDVQMMKYKLNKSEIEYQKSEIEINPKSNIRNPK